MGWARFDDNYTNHPKLREAGPWAELLDMRAIIWCCRYNTDGLVTRHAIEDIKHGIPRVAEKIDRLVAVGRWKTNPGGGWWVHDFLEFNPSKAQREAHKSAARERQARWRASRNGVTNGVTNGEVTMGRGRESLQATRTCARCAPNGFVLNAAGEAVRCAHEDESGNVVELRARLVGED